MVVDFARVESPSTLEFTANRVRQVEGFSMTYSILITDKSFISDIINQNFDTIIHSEENLCHSQNLIFLPSYKNRSL